MKIRNATPDDAEHFVQVFRDASHGLADVIWQGMAADGQSEDEIWAGLAADGQVVDRIAHQRMQKKLAQAPAGTALIAELDGRVAGGVITNDIGADPEVIGPDMPAMLVPLSELENLALRTHYVNAMAVFDGCRGQGVATALLDRVGRNAGPAGMSLIVSDANLAARRLYERLGYRETARRRLVRGGWDGPGDTWVLMIRP